MRCNCESGHCAHHHGDPSDPMDANQCHNGAGRATMAYVGAVCDACADVVEADAPSLITRSPNVARLRGDGWDSSSIPD